MKQKNNAENGQDSLINEEVSKVEAEYRNISKLDKSIDWPMISFSGINLITVGRLPIEEN